MLEGNKAEIFQNGEVRNNREIKSLSLESQQSNKCPNKNRPMTRIGFYNREWLKNNRSPFISPEFQKGKIFAFLIMLSLLVPPVLYVFVVPFSDDGSLIENEGDENPEWVEVPDNTLIFTAEKPSINRKNPKITGTRGYSGTSQPIGDWDITSNAVVWNETITLTGNLTITETGNLTLINVTLKVNCSYNGEFHIEVLGGGGLYIYDYDSDRFTEYDASNITTLNTANKYLFWIQKDANFEMKDSKLSWCGYEWGSNGDHAGLWINTNYTVINGNLITNNYNGIVFYKGFNNTIKNNTIRDSNSYQGIFLSRSSYNFLLTNIIHNNIQSGIYVISDSNENNIIENVVFDNSIHGIIISGSDKNLLFNNIIYGNSVQGINMISSLYNNISANTIYNNSHSGLYISSCSKNIVYNNTIYSNKIEGIYLISASNENSIIENVIFNNSVHGIVLSGSPKNLLLKNIIYNNIGEGIYFGSSPSNNLLNNKIYNNFRSGIYLTSSSKNIISDNDIYSNKIEGIYLISSSSKNNLTNNIVYDNILHGIALSGSSSNILSNNTLKNNHQYGICIISSSNNLMINCNLSSNENGGIYLISTSSYNIVVNSRIICPQGYDIRLKSDSHLIALNTSFNKTNIRFDDTSSTLTVQWYLHIKLINLDGMPIINTNVRIMDNANGTFDRNFSTDSRGLVRGIVTTEYVQDSSIITYFTPHNITATVYKYIKEYTCYAKPEPWMSRSKTIIIVFGFSGATKARYQMLYPGWNLISFPYIQSNSSTQAVLQPLEGYYKAVQWYNSTDSLDHWKHYRISKPSFMNDLDELNHKMGFWIYITSPEESGFLFNGTLPNTDQTIVLNPGWNLVGYPSLRSRFRDEALNNLQYGNDIRIIYYYYAKTHSWNSLEADEIMRRGVGYWFYTNSTLTWIVNTTVPPVYNIDKALYYDTIQEGIDDANEFDIIEIASGIFYENIKVNKSVILVGEGENQTIIIGGVNITSDLIYLSAIDIHNSTYAITLKEVNETYLSDIFIYNCTYGLLINNSINIDIKNILFTDCLYGIFSNNSSNATIANSTIAGFSLLNFLLLNSDITIINSTFNSTKVQFLGPNSNLTVQWFLHILTRDQLGSPINGTTVRLSDNENGTFDKIYYTNSEGFIRWIIITERIQNLSGNITFTPHNISAINPNFSFYDMPREVKINKTTTVVIISINTVFPTSIFNINRNRYYLTIQEAIDDANPYNIIRLSSGIYSEYININKPLILLGEDKLSTEIDGGGESHFNISSDDVTISNLNIQNYTYGIYLDSYNGFKILNTMILNNTYGIYSNNSSPIIDFCNINNNTVGILSFNFSYPIIINTTAQNEILDFSISDSYFTSLNTHFNTTKVIFLDSISNLTVKWYLHVLVQDATGWGIPGANVWIVDNDNGTFDKNFTTGPDGYIWYIILTERIQNLSGNVSFNPYLINVSYYDTEYGYGWLTFPDNPRNISINGSLFEIRKETFTSLEAIPEFSHILMPIIAIIATFIVFRKKQKKVENT